MALTVCKECNGGVSTTAKVCPHCGAKMKKGMLWKIFVGFIAFAVILNIIIGIKDNSAQKKETERIASLTPAQREAEQKEKEAKKKQQEQNAILSDAQYTCQQFVLKSLHDAKSAELDSYTKHYIKEEKNGVYFVQVAGRAKNGFGALRKTVFDCRIKSSGDKWVLISLKEH